MSQTSARELSTRIGGEKLLGYFRGARDFFPDGTFEEPVIRQKSSIEMVLCCGHCSRPDLSLLEKEGPELLHRAAHYLGEKSPMEIQMFVGNLKNSARQVELRLTHPRLSSEEREALSRDLARFRARLESIEKYLLSPEGQTKSTVRWSDRCLNSFIGRARPPVEPRWIASRVPIAVIDEAREACRYSSGEEAPIGWIANWIIENKNPHADFMTLQRKVRTRIRNEAYEARRAEVIAHHEALKAAAETFRGDSAVYAQKVIEAFIAQNPHLSFLWEDNPFWPRSGPPKK